MFRCHGISIEDKLIFYNVPYCYIRVGRKHPKGVELEFRLLTCMLHLRATKARLVIQCSRVRYIFLAQLTRWPYVTLTLYVLMDPMLYNNIAFLYVLTNSVELVYIMWLFVWVFTVCQIVKARLGITSIQRVNLGSYGPRREKTCLWGFSNNKSADLPARPRSLISASCYSLIVKYHI